jgi:glycosyltransferase involved in cell wall biosynthesis
MQKLEERCAKYGLKNSFKILGWRNDIHRLMRASDIFALPSYYWEGVPVSILEAMACAKPVVVTMNRGCVDIVINNETGFLVPIKQAAPFSEKLLILLDNEQLRTQMGQAGRRRVEQYFGLDYCTESIVDALERGFQKVRDDDT